MQHQINSNLSCLSKLDAVKKFTGLSKTTIYSYMKRGSFPIPIKTGERSVAWRIEDLEEWLNSRPIAAIWTSTGEKK